MSGSRSGEDSPIVSRESVTDLVRILLQAATTVTPRRFTVEQVSQLSGVSVRAIRSYMSNDPTEAREPTLSKALSLCVVLGAPAVNSILSLIGYTGAHPTDEPDDLQPSKIVADAMAGLSTIAAAAADNRIDHTEKPGCRAAADAIIAAVSPLSSMADAS